MCAHTRRMMKYISQLRWECAVRRFLEPPINDGEFLCASEKKEWGVYREHQLIQVWKRIVLKIYMLDKLIKVRSAKIKSEVPKVMSVLGFAVYIYRHVYTQVS